MLRLLAVLSGFALASCASSGWDAAVKDANESGKPLVVEFYADWCKPCLWFEKNVLPRDDVQSELGQVTFRRFDFDSRQGREYANRLGVRAVPMFVAVDEAGIVIGGLRGAAPPKRFIRFLRWVQQQKQSRSALPDET